jgi:GNAT superfamily N-acetyltransferase
VTAPTRARVAEACARWLWVPEGATLVETDDWTLVRYPAWAYTPLAMPVFRPSGDPGAALDEALAESRRLAGGEVDGVDATVGIDAADGVAALFEARGGELTEDTDVLAVDLADGVPDLGPVDDAVTCRWVVSADDARAYNDVAVEVFDTPRADADRIAQMARRGAEQATHGQGGFALALLDGEPVGTGGLEVAEGDARLYGGGVREAARGHGVYRALLRHRLAYAVEHGATLGLTKGRVATSGPILRRAGFEAFGRETTYRLPL